MYRKILSILGVFLIIVLVNSCSSKPEQGLLNRYFQALSLNDLTTLSTMAIEPAEFDVKNWEIVSVTEEVIQPTSLPDLEMKEKELQKNLEESVGITLDARDAWDDADFEAKRVRTRAAREKADELKIKYDEILATHKDLQKQFNEAKSEAKREEEISVFSLGVKMGDYPTIRQFSGDVHKKEVEVKVVDKEENARNYKIFMRQYILKDEVNNIPHRGRWIILKFEAT